jgi:hypothetical protein
LEAKLDEGLLRRLGDRRVRFGQWSIGLGARVGRAAAAGGEERTNNNKAHGRGRCIRGAIRQGRDLAYFT